ANESQMVRYEIESSADGNNFRIIGRQEPGNMGNGTYNYIDKDAQLGYHYYRIRGIDLSGKESYTQIAKVFIAETIRPSIGIYPNPITNGVVNLQLVNQPAGKYGIRLVNPVGQ